MPLGAAEEVGDLADGEVATADGGLRIGATFSESACDRTHNTCVELIE